MTDGISKYNSINGSTYLVYRRGARSKFLECFSLFVGINTTVVRVNPDCELWLFYFANNSERNSLALTITSLP